MARDGCAPKLAYLKDETTEAITGVTLTTTGNTCSVPIPITVPGTVTSTKGHTTEQLGTGMSPPFPIRHFKKLGINNE
jgi:hypothetical protein